MTLHRCFIAVELSEENRARVVDLQGRLRAMGAVVRWVKARNLHFTLRFLGEIPAAQLARAVVATRSAARGTSPFRVTIGGLGAFPSYERPQVVWLGTQDGADALERLAAAVNAALVRERFPEEPRRFRPHITIGRVRDTRQWAELVRALAGHREATIGVQPVEVVTVMESRLTPDGPVYTVREQVSLGQELQSQGN